MWYNHNLKEKSLDKKLQFDIKFNPTKFQKLSFKEATEFTVDEIRKIYHNKIYVALSGGADSEYILLSYYKMGYDITPIIVNTPFNLAERQYAYLICKKLRIEPIVLNMDANLFFAIYRRDIVQRFNCVGCSSSPTILAAHYAAKKEGVLLSGDHIIDDSEEFTTKTESNAYDHYTTTMYPENAVSFFIFKPELTYSFLKTLNSTQRLSEWKSETYDILFRPKIRYLYDGTAHDYMTKIETAHGIINYEAPKLPDVNSFIEMMEEWNK